jgi:3-hydroxyisobutyrate dehydrogenase/2-hydroxy-3-oxopropionate reductase
MVGGDQDALDRARPMLETFAKSIFYLGDIGAGATMKLVVNSLVHSLNVAVSEAWCLPRRPDLIAKRRTTSSRLGPLVRRT